MRFGQSPRGLREEEQDALDEAQRLERARSLLPRLCGLLEDVLIALDVAPAGSEREKYLRTVVIALGDSLDSNHEITEESERRVRSRLMEKP